MARVDLFLTAAGEFYVNEINTIPGFTAVSTHPKLWELSGISPTERVSRLLPLAGRAFLCPPESRPVTRWP